MKKLLLVIFSVLLSWTVGAANPTIVVVGGYHVQPYVRANYDGTGITQQLLERLNEAQSQYHFIFTPIPAKRRYEFLTEGKVHLICFEEPLWGWAPYDVDFSKPLMVAGLPYQDSDLFISLLSTAKNQQYFDSLEGKSVVVTRGYHYDFADFNADEALLMERFKARIVSSPENVIHMVLEGRGDIGLVSRSLIQDYLKTYPADAERLLVSERADHYQNLKIIINKGAPINKTGVDQLLHQLEQSGSLDDLFRQHNLLDEVIDDASRAKAN